MKLTELRSSLATPAGYLRQVISVLNEPEKYLSLETMSVHLNSMNIIEPDDSGDVVRRIEFTEFTLKEEMKAVAVIIRVPRSEAPK